MDLAIASFMIAIVGIVLQIADAFPEHRETRKAIVTICIGFFVGVISSALINTRYQITGNFDSRYAILFSLIAISLAFGLMAVLLSDVKKREAAGAAAGIGVVVFAFAGFGIGLGSIDRNLDLTTDEVAALAARAEQRGEYEKALAHLRNLQMRLNGESSVRVRQRIENVEKARAAAVAGN